MLALFVIFSLFAPIAAMDPLTMPVVDGHVHLVDPAQGLEYSWSPASGFGDTCHQNCAVCTGNVSMCNIFRHWTVQDYQMTQIYNTSKIVFMEVSTAANITNQMGIKEAEWVQSMADSTQPLIRGIVAQCPLQFGSAVEPCLQAVAQLSLVRGIRSPVTFTPDGSALDPDFVAGVKLLAKYNLSYDMLCTTATLPLLTGLVQQVPGVTFILDHLAGPLINDQGGDFPVWSVNIAAIAQFPNVMIKISGGPQQYGGPAWTIEAVGPFVRFCLQQFGVARAFYSGNWFWVNNYSSLGRWSTGLWEIVSTTLSDADLTALFYGTASRVYRLD